MSNFARWIRRLEPGAFALYMILCAVPAAAVLSIFWHPLEAWVNDLAVPWTFFWIAYYIGTVRQWRHSQPELKRITGLLLASNVELHQVRQAAAFPVMSSGERVAARSG